MKRLDYNDKLAHFETDLLDLPQRKKGKGKGKGGKKGGKKDKGQHGLPGREQFKHVIFGPQAWGGDGGGDGPVAFPGVRDAMEDGDWALAEELVERAAGVIRRAGERLVE